MPPSLSNTPSGNQNSFYGEKVSKPGINVNNAGDNQLLYKNDYQAQTFFGSSGDISFGIFTSAVTSNQAYGMQVVDSNGNVTFEMDGQTWYWFDTNGNIVMMVGYLPVSKTYGWAVSPPNTSLAGVV
jgi:hypothetical protein